jgi:hypothetical protein
VKTKTHDELFSIDLVIGSLYEWIVSSVKSTNSTGRKKNMPKDSKHPQLPARQFEFQKSQSEMAEESEPFTDETDKPNLTQAKRVAEVIAEAHRKVEKRKKRGVARAGGRQSIAAGKRSAKKVARKSAKKTMTRAGTKRRANVKSSGSQTPGR